MGNLLKSKEKQEYFYWHTLGQRKRGCSRLGSSLSSFIAWIQAFPSCCCPSVLLPSPLPSPIPLNRHICLVIIHSPGGSQRALLKCKSEHTMIARKLSCEFPSYTYKENIIKELFITVIFNRFLLTEYLKLSGQ